MPAHLHVITGPMFSGKSEALLGELARARFASKRVRVLKPQTDTRTSTCIASRVVDFGTSTVSREASAEVITSHHDFVQVLNSNDFDVLGIDEVQFFPTSRTSTLGWFGREIYTYLQRNRARDVRIIVSGLDQDFRGLPFGPIPALMALADRVDKLTGVCMVCGSYSACHSQRISAETRIVSVGDSEQYQVRCRTCFSPP